MYLIDEKHTGDNFCFAFFAPFANLSIDLIAKLGLNLTCVTGKEREKTLRARVNNINLVERHGVYDFSAALQLTLWTLNEFGVATNGIVVTRARKAPTKLGNTATRLFNCDNIASDHLFLLQSINHFVTKFINCLHIRRLDDNLACFSGSGEAAVNLNFHNLSLDCFSLFLDAHTNSLSKGLHQCLSFAHF